MRVFLVLSICTLSAAAAPAPTDKEEPPAKKELFAKEDWYKDQKEKEGTFSGVLQKKKDGGGIGIVQRFNPYQLLKTETVKVPVNRAVEVAENVNGVIVKKVVTVTEIREEKRVTTQDIYVGDKTDILDAYVGKNVKLTGKLVTMELEGQKIIEIWPAAVELLPDKDEKKPEGKKDDKKPTDKVEGDHEVKIIARGAWRPGSKEEAQHLVIRNAEELAKASGLEKPDGEGAQKKASEAVAKALKIDEIDWKKQMLIVVSAGRKNTGGYSVEITGIDRAEDKQMTVHWKLNTPKPGGPVTQTITHPALTAVAERFGGKVVFDPPLKDDADK
jgi:hypothetical protein